MSHGIFSMMRVKTSKFSKKPMIEAQSMRPGGLLWYATKAWTTFYSFAKLYDFREFASKWTHELDVVDILVCISLVCVYYVQPNLCFTYDHRNDARFPMAKPIVPALQGGERSPNLTMHETMCMCWVLSNWGAKETWCCCFNVKYFCFVYNNFIGKVSIHAHSALMKSICI